MEIQKDIPSILGEIALKKIQRIDAALEGDWNATLVTVWTRDKGLIDFSDVIWVHPRFKPSLEMYFEGAWLGLHCFNRIKGENVFDEKFARQIISYVESKFHNET